MRMKSKCRILIFLVVFVMVTLYQGKVAFAYVHNGYPVGTPNAVGIYATSGEYQSKIYTYAKKWNQCPELSLYTTTNAAAIVHASVENSDTDSYAITYYYGNDNKSIVFYKDWLVASDSIKNETIVHEFGHAVGLSHTQSQNEKVSVMRAFDFNNKAYPLSDDKEGIAALY